MSLEEIKRFNNDAVGAQKLMQGIQQAGSDVDKILGVAKSHGYDISIKDVEKSKQHTTPGPDGSEPNKPSFVIFALAV